MSRHWGTGASPRRRWTSRGGASPAVRVVAALEELGRELGAVDLVVQRDRDEVFAGLHAPQIVEVDRFLDELESFHAAPQED
jgi:hypothetical protein